MLGQRASEAEFEERVREALPAALRLAVRLCGDTHLAEDAVQEALVRVMRYRKDFREASRFETWLGRIVIHAVRDLHARRKHANSIGINDWNEEPGANDRERPDEQASIAELRDLVQAAVMRLPDRQREVMVLSLWEQRSATEIAELLEMDPQNVYATLHAAKQNLRSLLPHSLRDSHP